jgi:hypothetical protein
MSACSSTPPPGRGLRRWAHSANGNGECRVDAGVHRLRVPCREPGGDHVDHGEMLAMGNQMAGLNFMTASLRGRDSEP